MGTLHLRVAGDCVSAHPLMADCSEGPLGAKSARACWCVCCIIVYLYEWDGPLQRTFFFFFFLRAIFFPSLKIKTPPQAGFAVQICPREDAGWGGGGGGSRMKHSGTSLFKGNRKRLRERDSGARSLGTIKIAL